MDMISWDNLSKPFCKHIFAISCQFSNEKNGSFIIRCSTIPEGKNYNIIVWYLSYLKTHTSKIERDIISTIKVTIKLDPCKFNVEGFSQFVVSNQVLISSFFSLTFSCLTSTLYYLSHSHTSIHLLLGWRLQGRGLRKWRTRVQPYSKSLRHH